ncbi:MAG: hypothetical protein AAB443_02935 [Patescibacteria group bacterium]
MSEHKDNKYHRLKYVFDESHKNTVLLFNKTHKSLLEKAKNKGFTLSAAAIIATSFAASAPSENKLLKTQITAKNHKLSKEELLFKIAQITKNKQSLTEKDESEIEHLLSSYFNLDLKVKLENNRLNQIYGFIGAEQHLYRWPGDTLMQHTLIQSGIAPQRGAFGYFDTNEQEQYYIAAQLHMISNWNREWPTLKPWYRFRKVLVFNPDNGKAVISVIGDSGPAAFTGKTFGGSPEIMKHLERVDGTRKGKVVVLFLNEQGHEKITLGPIGQNSRLAAK